MAKNYGEIMEEMVKGITADQIYVSHYHREDEQQLFDFANPYGRFAYRNGGPMVWLTLEGICDTNKKARESQK